MFPWIDRWEENKTVPARGRWIGGMLMNRKFRVSAFGSRGHDGFLHGQSDRQRSSDEDQLRNQPHNREDERKIN